MSIQKSSSWSNNGKFKDDNKLYKAIPRYDEEDDCGDLLDNEYEEENPSINNVEDNDEGDEEVKPLFNKNFYLDEEMYDGFKNSKGDKEERLKYLTTTSEKEDKIFDKTSLTFLICLLVVCLVEGILKFTKGEGFILKFLTYFRYIVAIVLTVVVIKWSNTKNKKLSSGEE